MNVGVVTVLAGPGVVAALDGAVLWAEPTDLRAESLFGQVLSRLSSAGSVGSESAGAAGSMVSAELLAEWLLEATSVTDGEGSTLPAFALALPDGDQRVVCCRGWGAVVTPAGPVEAGVVTRVSGRGAIAVGRTGLATVGVGDSVLGLERGVVPGGAAVLSALRSAGVPLLEVPSSSSNPVSSPVLAPVSSPVSSPVEQVSSKVVTEPSVISAVVTTPEESPSQSLLGSLPPPVGSPAPVPVPQPPALAQAAPQPTPPAAPEQHVVVSLQADLAREPVAARAPLPVARPGTAAPPERTSGIVVEGILCSRQHFNNPSSLYCRVCGISMHQQTHTLVRGDRPSLGVLVTDEGVTFGLDADYAVGSSPEHSAPVHQELARPLNLGEAAAGVAPVHIAITLDGWDVLAWNQSPGLPAAVLHRGDREWMPIAPGHHIRLLPGSFVGFCGRHLVFESNNRA